MHISTLVELLGSKGSDAHLQAWFAQHGIGKPPATISANQGQKSVKDKLHDMEFYFAFDIINDRFYPPTSGARGSLLSHFKSATLFSRRPKGNPPKPEGFWDGYVQPAATLQDCLAYFNGLMEEFGDTVYFERPLTGDVEIKLWFCKRRQRVDTIQLNLREDREFIGHHDFNPGNEHNTTPQAATLVLKWLFDRRHLRVPQALYEAGLEDDHQAILRFADQHLGNHVWAGQLHDSPALRSLLAHTRTTRPLQLDNGSSLHLFDKWLYLKAGGAWERHQALYNDDTLVDWSASVDAFERAVVLDAAQRQAFLALLDDAYQRVQQAQPA